MEGKDSVDSPTIKPINKGVVHRICSGQVILDLSSAVKELVENSLDAGATSIEIVLKEYGQESIKVIDNGCGISPNNFKALALKHHTSKLTDFPDLQSLTTFGFRGEALSSLCMLGNLTVETRTKNEPVATHLTFDHTGLLTCEKKIARQVGTTITVEKLFSTLPVRSKEFTRNIRKEYGKLISLLNAYALVAKGVRIVCTNTTGKNVKSTVLNTQGSSSIKDNIITVFGMNTFTCLEPFSVCISDSCKVEGFVSKPGQGSGRNLGDRQYFFVNGRPVDMPKVSKLMNELYKTSNSRQYPIMVMDFAVPTRAYDVNVTPDKRKIFFSDEGALLQSLRNAIGNIYSPSHCSYLTNNLEESKNEPNSFDLYDPPAEANLPSKQIPSKDCKHKEAVSSEGQTEEDDIPLKMGQKRIPDPYVKEDMVHMEDKRTVGKDFTLRPHVTEKAAVSSGYQTKQLRSPIPSSTSDKFGQSPIREVKKHNIQNVQSSSRSSIVQSSITNFVTVNKRKLENEYTLLSEMPVLRNEKVRCQVRKTNTSMQPVILRSVVDRRDDPSEENENKPSASMCSEIVDVSGEVEASSSGGGDLNYGESEKEILNNQEVPLPAALPGKDLEILDNISEDLSGTVPESNSSDVKVDAPVPSSSLELCSVLQFDIKDLKASRERRSRLTKGSTHERMKTRRCFCAATLELSQPENVERKEKALAAATTELERFFNKKDFARMEVVGQFNLGFIIGRLDKDLFIVDQHAADEKYNFERLSQSTILNQQPLLQPMRLELSPEEEVIASMHMDVIRKNGFTLVEDIHAPPGHHFRLKAVPFSKNITFGAEDVKELISTLADSQGECSMVGSYRMDTADSLCPSRVRAMLASRACRSSTMIGDPLGKNEMKKILEHLADLKSPWNCPHGRPTMRHLADLTTIHRKQELDDSKL